MTKSEGMTKSECRNRRPHNSAHLDIRASDFFRHSSFVIRHSTTYRNQVDGPNPCENERALPINRPVVLVVVLVLVLDWAAWIRGRGRRARGRSGCPNLIGEFAGHPPIDFCGPATYQIPGCFRALFSRAGSSSARAS